MYKCQCDQYKKATHLTKFGVVEVDDHCIVPQTGSVWIPISAHLYCGSSGQALAFLCTMVIWQSNDAWLNCLVVQQSLGTGTMVAGCSFILLKQRGVTKCSGQGQKLMIQNEHCSYLVCCKFSLSSLLQFLSGILIVVVQYCKGTKNKPIGA